MKRVDRDGPGLRIAARQWKLSLCSGLVESQSYLEY